MNTTKTSVPQQQDCPIPKKRVRKPSARIWKTKDGTQLRVRDMSDSHLINSYCFVVRAHERLSSEWAMDAMSYAEGAPDGAAMAAGMAAEGFLEESDYPTLTAIDDTLASADDSNGNRCTPLYDELIKRGLLDAAHKRLGVEVEDDREK